MAIKIIIGLAGVIIGVVFTIIVIALWNCEMRRKEEDEAIKKFIREHRDND